MRDSVFWRAVERFDVAWVLVGGLLMLAFGIVVVLVTRKGRKES